MQRRLSASWAEAPPRSPQGSLNAPSGVGQFAPVRLGREDARTPQSSSMSGSRETTSLACSSKEASRARCFEPPSGDLVAVLRYLQRPKNPELQSAPRPDGNTDTAQPLPAGPGRGQSPSGRLSAANEYRTR